MARARHPRYDPKLRERAAKLYESGLSIRKVAAEMKLSPTRVAVLLDDAGVETRGHGRPRIHAAETL